MRKNSLIAILAVLSVTGCGTQRKAAVGEAYARKTLQALGYTDSLEATFFYTEGVKTYALAPSEPEEALNLFSMAVKADSNHAPSYYEMGNVYMSVDPARALEASIRANRLDSSNVWYRTQMARLMVMEGRYDQAVVIYDELRRKVPHNPDNYRMLAALYDHAGQPFTAISILDSAQYKLGRTEELSLFKRELLINVKLYDKAIAETREMIADNPYLAGNYLALGNLYALTGKDSLALANFNESLKLDPGNAAALGVLNEYHKKKNDIPNFFATAKQIFLSDDVEAGAKVKFFGEITSNRDFYSANFFQINDLATTLAVKYPDNFEVIDLYAGHTIASGEPERALELYKNHLGNAPRTAETYKRIIETEAYLQRSDSVDKYSLAAIRDFPDDAELYLRRGYALSYMNRGDEALEVFRSAVGHTGSDSLRSVVYGVMGDMEHQAGNDRRSFALYGKALRADPDNAMVLNNYAYYLASLDRDLERALEMTVRSNRLSGGNPTYLDTHAWVLYKMGRYEQARKIMQQAISLDRSDSSELAVHYGDILYALGDQFMASIYWNKALERGYDAEIIRQKLEQPGK